MYINNNVGQHRHLYQNLQEQIHILNNQFSSWKIILNQLPRSASLQGHPIIPDIFRKLDAIHTIVINFCQHFDRELASLKDRQGHLSKVGAMHCESRPAVDDQKFQIVNEKINILEQNLKKTQKSEKKLVQTLNYMMEKYQDINHQYQQRSQNQCLPSNESSSKANNSFIPLRVCGNPKAPHNSRSKDKISTRFSKKEDSKNVYLLPEQSFALDYSTQSNPYPSTQQAQMKIFSQDPAKKSLKSMKGSRPGIINEERRSHMRDSQTNRSSKNLSLDHHDHRFHYMMSNLGH